MGSGSEGLKDSCCCCRSGRERKCISCPFKGSYCGLEVVSIRVGTAGIFIKAYRVSHGRLCICGGEGNLRGEGGAGTEVSVIII